MRKKTKNRHGGFGLQVLLLMLVMLVGGGSTECISTTEKRSRLSE